MPKKKAAAAIPSLTDLLFKAIETNDWAQLDKLLKEHKADPNQHVLGSPLIAWAARRGSIPIFVKLITDYNVKLSYLRENEQLAHILIDLVECRDTNKRLALATWLQNNFVKIQANIAGKFALEHITALRGQLNVAALALLDRLNNSVGTYYLVSGHQYDKLQYSSAPVLVTEKILDEIPDTFTESEEPSLIAYLKKYLPKINLTNKLVHCVLKDNIGINSLIEYIFKNPACSVSCNIVSNSPETNGMSLAQLIFNYARENTSSIDDARSFLANPRNKIDLTACLNRLLAPEDGMPLYLLMAVAEEYPTLEAAFENNNTNVLNPNTSITNIKHRGRTFAWYLAFHGKVAFLKKVNERNGSDRENLDLNAHSSDPKDKEYGKTVLSYLIDHCDDETIKGFVKNAKDKIDLHACSLHPKNKSYQVTIANKLKKLGRSELLAFLNSYAKTPVSLDNDETNPKIINPDSSPAEENLTPQKQLEKLLTEMCKENQVSYQIEPTSFNKFKVIFLGNLKQVSQLSKGAPDFDGPLSIAKDQYQWTIQATEERLRKS